MPVLDVRALKSEQLKMLASTYDSVAGLELSPLAQLEKDAVRLRIDDSISKVLGLPSLTSIRELLAREPGLSALEINPRQAEQNEIEDDPAQAALL
jgi:hypothetical protein